MHCSMTLEHAKNKNVDWITDIFSQSKKMLFGLYTKMGSRCIGIDLSTFVSYTLTKFITFTILHNRSPETMKVKFQRIQV